MTEFTLQLYATVRRIWHLHRCPSCSKQWVCDEFDCWDHIESRHHPHGHDHCYPDRSFDPRDVVRRNHPVLGREPLPQRFILPTGSYFSHQASAIIQFTDGAGKSFSLPTSGLSIRWGPHRPSNPAGYSARGTATLTQDDE